MAEENAGLSRRAMLGVTAAAVAGVASAQPRARRAAKGMPGESQATPHICLGPIADSELNPQRLRRYTQFGLSHVILNGTGFPWNADTLRAKVALLRDNGLTVGDIGLPWSGPAGAPTREIVYARPGRDKAIEDVRRSIRAAGAAGIPVVEYNFYAHRLEEGYFDAPDPTRGGAMIERFDYAKVRDLPPLADEGVHTLDQIWANCAYFLAKVVPVAEEAGVVLALHPNDPPAPVSRGSGQIMATLAGWKSWLASTTPRPNTIIFDCGVTCEIGEDPVAVARWFAGRKRIGHVHFRNVRVRTPSLDYEEVYPDNGEVDMFAVMQALVGGGYRRMIFPEHARGLDVDRQLSSENYAAWAFQVGYTRATLQAVLRGI